MRRSGEQRARPLKRALPAAALALAVATSFVGASAFAAGAVSASGTNAKAAAGATNAAPWAGIGRPATRSEIHAWDIDVRADFKGLPQGSGSVEAGERIWEEKCAICHGTFGESNEVFTPIVGGTTKEDIASGHVANLKRTDFPQRSTMMKLSQVSTLWDYIRRAMPWNAPKSLSPDEVYAVTAYILNLADIVPADFVLSDRNMVDVQKRLPNRDGLTFYEPMWRVDGKQDVQGDACMSGCATDPARLAVAGLPEHARDAHGNLMAQNRIIGPVRGADTTRPPPSHLDGAEVAANAQATMLASIPHMRKPEDLAREANCMACHAVDAKMVGPSFREVGAKYRGRPGVAEMLTGRVKNGTSGAWGDVPMPANAAIADDDIRVIVNWILEDRQ